MRAFRFTLSPYLDDDDHDEPVAAKIPPGFDTIAQALEWTNAHQIPTYTLRITESDIDGPEGPYGHDTIGTVNLEVAELDKLESLAFIC